MEEEAYKDGLSISQGSHTTASGFGAHSEGIMSAANGDYSHAEGEGSQANGGSSHTEGEFTIAVNDYEHAQGHFNYSMESDDPSKSTICTIGVGMSDNERKNAVQVMRNGDVYVTGVGGFEGNSEDELDLTKSVQEMMAFYGRSISSLIRDMEELREIISEVRRKLPQ